MKKRILSLILALSMVLSVLPLGAFAADPLPELVMDANGYPVGSNGGENNCEGNGWEYKGRLDPNNSSTLILKNGTYNFNYTKPKTNAGGPANRAVQCAVMTQSGVTITGGTFNGAVYNLTETISGGIFNGTVTNDPTGKISGGTFAGSVENGGTIENGTFEGTVTNDVTGYITGGTFQSTCSVTNTGIIKDGIFTIKVENGGIGEIFGGIFAAGLSKKSGNVAGGVFNGKTGLDGVTGLHSITWDAASSKAKIVAVNDVSAVWDPYAYKDTTVTITADTEIYSLNGKSIDDGNCKSSYDGNKNTVKFTMPGENVVLNGAITSTDLVMENGYPKDSNGGKNPCKGNDWSYDHSTDTLTLTSGEYDFSSTEPVQCAIKSSATITGGIFDGTVTNNAGGTISDGTFYGTVTNNTKGDITGGTFNGTVTNNGTITGNGTFLEKVTNNQGGNITNGTFNHTVENYGGTISSGTFKGTVQNWYGTISGGTFHEKVLNSNGEITGGTFAAGLSANHNTVTGGVFNGKTGLDGVTGVHSITVATGAKIKEVNGMSADWDPYVVVTENATPNEVIITADTEIFSLNGKSIGDGNCKSSYGSNNKIVKFTMPDEDVVLNGAITCTDLVMEKGWPKASNEGTISCEGTDWSYDHITKTLTLTSGTFDFSSTHPQNTSAGTQTEEPVKCAIVIESGAEITGGTFEKKVTNNAGGTISGGTFQDTCSVTNNGTIKNGTFKNVCSVTNEGANATIENGTFKNMCRVTNNSTIENGTFKDMCSVENNGTINNGTFTYKVENNGIITGGVFNGNANLTGVTGGYNITVASNAKIEKVNGVSADWAPYVVTSNATT